LYLLPGQYDLYHCAVPTTWQISLKSQVFVKCTSHGNAVLQSIPGQLNMGTGFRPCPYFVSRACLLCVNPNLDHGRLLSDHLLLLYHLHFAPLLPTCTFMECMGQLYHSCTTEVIVLSYNTVCLSVARVAYNECQKLVVVYFVGDILVAM
jgi:hypothetical protein